MCDGRVIIFRLSLHAGIAGRRHHRQRPDQAGAKDTRYPDGTLVSRIHAETSNVELQTGGGVSLSAPVPALIFRQALFRLTTTL